MISESTTIFGLEERMGIFRLRFPALVLAGVLLVWVCPFPALSIEEEKSDREARDTAQQIDLFTANLFHKRLSIISKKAFVAVSYAGTLAHSRKPAGAELLETVNDDVIWNVTEVDTHGSDLGRVIFNIRISLKKQADTVAACKINGKTLYLKVTDLPEKWTVDTAMPRSSKGMTIRKILKSAANED